MKTHISLTIALSSTVLVSAFSHYDLQERDEDLELWERDILEERDFYDDSYDGYDLLDGDIDDLYERDHLDLDLDLDPRDYPSLYERTGAAKAANKATTRTSGGSGCASSGLSPCPMLNALNKAGVLPSTGITKDVAVKSFSHIGLAPDMAAFLFAGGVGAGKDGKSFALMDLRAHGKVEHDGSLSRTDAWTGNNWAFNPERFATYLKGFGGKSVVTMKDMAAARTAMIKKSQALAKAGGGTWSLSPKSSFVSFGESSLVHAVLSGGSGSVKVEDLKTLFSKCIRPSTISPLP